MNDRNNLELTEEGTWGRHRRMHNVWETVNNFILLPCRLWVIRQWDKRENFTFRISGKESGGRRFS